MLQQCATNNGAECNCHTRHCRPQTNCFCALNGISKNVCDDCKSCGEYKSCTNAHGTTPKNELIASGCECCKRAADHKQHKTNLQCSLATEAITKATSGQQQTCKHQRVRINNPLQGSCCCIQFALQCGQCHVHNEVVDDDKEHADGKYS